MRVNIDKSFCVDVIVRTDVRNMIIVKSTYEHNSAIVQARKSFLNSH